MTMPFAEIRAEKLRSVKTWFAIAKHIEWLAQSPDLNTTEQV